MTAHIMCLTSSGGIPLFVRKKGDGELVTILFFRVEYFFLSSKTWLNLIYCR